VSDPTWLSPHDYVRYVPPQADEVDMVNSPPHYADGWSNGAEVIDIVENLNFNRGNCIKYCARAGRKSKETELKDLKKGRWYLDREIARLEAHARG